MLFQKALLFGKFCLYKGMASILFSSVFLKIKNQIEITIWFRFSSGFFFLV